MQDGVEETSASHFSQRVSQAFRSGVAFFFQWRQGKAEPLVDGR